MSPKNNVTIREVAQKAGVSISTVSRFLNNPNSTPSATNEKIQSVMIELGYRPNQLARYLAEGTRIVFTASTAPLTPDFLSNSLAPYLQAINSLQKLINELKKKPSKDIRIESISQHSPISVSLDGAGGAIKSIEDIMVPWRRKHYESMASLEEQEKLAEIENTRAETLERRANAAKSRAEAEKISAEANDQRQQSEISRLTAEKIKMELQHEKVNLALDVLNSIAPNLSPTEKVEYLQRILEVVDVIGTSELEIDRAR